MRCAIFIIDCKKKPDLSFVFKIFKKPLSQIKYSSILNKKIRYSVIKQATQNGFSVWQWMTLFKSDNVL